MFVEKSVSKSPFWEVLLRLLLCWLLLASLAAAGHSARAQAEMGISAPAVLSTGAADGAAIWGDIDNDGDQDLLISGRGNNEAMTTSLFRNNGGTLTNEGSAGLPQLESSSLSLGDYDNDGYLDVLITGQSGVNFDGVLPDLIGVGGEIYF